MSIKKDTTDKVTSSLAAYIKRATHNREGIPKDVLKIIAQETRTAHFSTLLPHQAFNLAACTGRLDMLEKYWPENLKYLQGFKPQYLYQKAAIPLRCAIENNNDEVIDYLLSLVITRENGIPITYIDTIIHHWVDERDNPAMVKGLLKFLGRPPVIERIAKLHDVKGIYKILSFILKNKQKDLFLKIWSQLRIKTDAALVNILKQLIITSFPYTRPAL